MTPAETIGFGITAATLADSETVCSFYEFNGPNRSTNFRREFLSSRIAIVAPQEDC
jgi:hypothetical protein